MTEPSPKRVTLQQWGTPRRYRRSTGRRLAVTHSDGEAYSSPTLVRRPLAFRTGLHFHLSYGSWGVLTHANYIIFARVVSNLFQMM